MTATQDTAPRDPAARFPTQRKPSLNITAALDAKLAQMIGRTTLTKTAILEVALDSYHAVVMKSPDMTLGCIQPTHPGGIWLTVGPTHNQRSLSGPLCTRCTARE